VNQEERYLKYLTLHKKAVVDAWEDIKNFMTTAPFVKNKEVRERIDNLVMDHDKSKYSNEEFEAYRQWFYPYKKEKRDRKIYDIAWEHHWQNNPHHVRYWLVNEFDMARDHVYLVEMACDWIATGRGPGRTPSIEYFNNTRKDIVRVLPTEAVAFLEYILLTIDRKTRRIRV